MQLTTYLALSSWFVTCADAAAEKELIIVREILKLEINLIPTSTLSSVERVNHRGSTARLVRTVNGVLDVVLKSFLYRFCIEKERKSIRKSPHY